MHDDIRNRYLYLYVGMKYLVLRSNLLNYFCLFDILLKTCHFLIYNKCAQEKIFHEKKVVAFEHKICSLVRVKLGP